MPHKHTRKDENKTSSDLPPTFVAKPLSASKSAASNGVFTTEVSANSRSSKRKHNANNTDDTPKAFARLMSFHEGKRLRNGLDNGVRLTKKQRKAAEAEKTTSSEKNLTVSQSIKPEMPTIKPGERMSEFSARVDTAIPIAGLINKTSRGGKDPLGLKLGRTKKERKMHKLYDEWREQDKRIKDKRQEALELAAEEEDEEANIKWKVDMLADEKNGKKKGKGKKRVTGEVEDGDDNPWAAIIKARNEGPRKLNDVVQAPPQFKTLPKEKFKVRDARIDVADVPKASGSLRRREELGEVRRSIIEGYRQIMKTNTSKIDRGTQ